ncbi:Na+/H+ antiporter subunit G [Malaciobacter canalis]|jgi:multicomponent K+:H+ antiporter subunit G|uniref:Multisubunit potassium/proton antiporter PhaG subunit n=2 Tax=Malaciobacter TaxID=2321114 RepID=A0AB36ZSU5_9BACT|nr:MULTISPECIES: Na+/H+ antiporter subunit G [Malaciobacter]PHO11172.1 Na+/H+ antiporter subunit G [Malaciobacter canalis]PPK58287.1 multisubunit potassium/proton antiporter PhaG subunit [Malaciobacter marinus]QEE33257.1 multisubunit sodium:proton antiporter, MnhG subunit [Malaciobacter canalis]SKB32243.1 multisubunit potassium/proton antiporter, PhaG subunit [Malaciobacter marinus]
MFEFIISLLIFLGAFFTLVGSIGLVKLPDFFTRLHAPTKATTLGVGAVLVASTLYFTFTTGELSLHEVLITLFLFITAPISAHLMAKSAMHIKKNEEKIKEAEEK